jgi:hypothetical protein
VAAAAAAVIASGRGADGSGVKKCDHQIVCRLFTSEEPGQQAFGALDVLGAIFIGPPALLRTTAAATTTATATATHHRRHRHRRHRCHRRHRRRRRRRDCVCP